MGNAHSPTMGSSPALVSNGSSTSSNSLHRHQSQDSLPSRGRQLLDSFDKARNDHKIKSLGEGEDQTINFCQDVLRLGAPGLHARYTVKQTISCGTTGVVCLALDATTQERVAIKYCKLGKDHTSREFKERRRQFEAEAKYQQRCACAQVVKLIDFQIVGAFALFMMEYLPRTLLDDIVESNRQLTSSSFPELRAARHVRNIALALANCHKMSVGHLDVKLDNCLVSQQGEAKLCDFGLAEQVPTNRNVATPLYSPPEIITAGRCNEKADMWSLGVCLFILVSGYPPFQPDERNDLEHNITHGRYLFKSEEGWDHVSALARDLIARLLVIDPEARFSAKQVLEHPWIVASERAKPVSKPSREARFDNMTGPPPLLRLGSTLMLEEMHENKKELEEQVLLQNQQSFLEFALDVRQAWDKSGWQGVMQEGRYRAELAKEGFEAGGLAGALTRVVKTPSQLSLQQLLLDDELKRKLIAPVPSQPLSLVREEEGDGGGGGGSEEDDRPLRRSVRADSDKHFMRNLYGSTSPLLAPRWVPDYEASVCRLCDEPFTFCVRRHHCRACGQVICSACSRTRRVVDRVDKQHKVRVCDLCTFSSKSLNQVVLH
ncbi:hypothetical protein BASA81_008007 [Batrachochytrium salamandrivorans]|nr:hypothetical protein BASA81_008007 [Batrachochytrium salamandrivorans]